MTQEKTKRKKKESAKPAFQCSEYEQFCKNPEINFGIFFLGIIIVALGIFILGESLGILKMDLNFWKLWPLILIFFGLTILDRKSIVNTIIGILAILATIFIVSLSFSSPMTYFSLLASKSTFISQPKTQEIIPSQSFKNQNFQLFYYNKEQDTDVTCGSDFILPIETSFNINNKWSQKEIVKIVINRLISGNLSENFKSQGYENYFDNPDFKLLKVEINDGTMILTFNEVPGFTSGGACRTRILKNQIIKTAEQFSDIKEVILMPENIFEP